jgi:hypothetical protein
MPCKKLSVVTDNNWHGFPRDGGGVWAQYGCPTGAKPMTTFAARSPAGRPRQVNPEETGVGEDTEDLPLSPDEDMSVIPDEERVLDVPS